MAWKRSSVRSRPGPPTLLMAAVYIVQSESTQKFYIGCTTRLGSRVGEHQRGQTVSIRGRGPWILVYQEQCDTLAGARPARATAKELEVASFAPGADRSFEAPRVSASRLAG